MIFRADTHVAGDATPDPPVQFGTVTPSWNIGRLFTSSASKCFPSSLESSRNREVEGIGR